MDSLGKEIYRKIKNKVARRVKALSNLPILQVDELILGQNVVIEPGVEIYCKRLVLGDGVVIKTGTSIKMPDLVVGDYTRIYNNCFLTGTNWCRIGHNCWFGHYAIIDSIGTTRIGDNVTAGAHSQLWTHIYGGDIVEGCRFASHRPLVIEDDAWFVAHCIVYPIRAEKRSMALVGSVVTKDMKQNHVYSGLPAKDVTRKMGNQFQELSLKKKRQLMEKYLKLFLEIHKPRQNRIRIVDKINSKQKEYSQFSLTERQYVKNLYPEEVQFMRFLLPTRTKFLPIPQTDWVSTYLSDIKKKGAKKR